VVRRGCGGTPGGLIDGGRVPDARARGERGDERFDSTDSARGEKNGTRVLISRFQPARATPESGSGEPTDRPRGDLGFVSRAFRARGEGRGARARVGSRAGSGR
jgi:hypothetical protein